MYCYGDHLSSTIPLAWQKAYESMDKYGYLGNTVQEILDGITYRTEEIVKENAAIEESIKSIENQLDVLKQKYDAATAAAKNLAAANNAAASSGGSSGGGGGGSSSGSGVVGKYRVLYSNGAVAASGFSDEASARGWMGVHHLSETRGASVQAYHTGTNYVEKASSWLDDMLGLGADETAAILKKGEAVIPDYNNPSNPSSGFSYGKMAESMSKSVGYSNSNNDNSASISIGDIVIQGNADDSVVEKLDKVRKQIVDYIK